MDLFGAAQGLVGTLLYFAALGLALFGLIDAVRTPQQAFAAAGKQTKQLWLIILGVASAVLFVTGPLGGFLFGIAAVVAAGVYVVDVRPAVKQMGGRGGNQGGSQEGPYGPW
jgi:4-amino-4-deoxy-L-arabinose transferase-like glycosyltransferase